MHRRLFFRASLLAAPLVVLRSASPFIFDPRANAEGLTSTDVALAELIRLNCAGMTTGTHLAA